jgi:hypothetical protein
MASPFSNLNLFKSSFLSTKLTKLDPSKFQAMHFTIGIDEREERWEMLTTVTVGSHLLENYK